MENDDLGKLMMSKTASCCMNAVKGPSKELYSVERLPCFDARGEGG